MALLTSTELAVRREAAARVVAERQANIRALVEVASGDDTQEYKTPSERRNSPKRVALSCLGALRADDRAAIAVLWKNLEYRQGILEGTLHRLTDPGSYYPAAAALVRIGKPACEEAWRELEASTDPVRVDLATYVLWRVEGPEVMQFLLDRKLSRLAGQPEIIADATPHKRNLERARAWITDRAKDGSSGGKPPTIGGRPLVDWFGQPGAAARPDSPPGTRVAQTRPSSAPAAMSIPEALEAFRAHPEGFRWEPARIVKPLIKNGMTKPQVQELLGPPNRETHEGTVWHFDVFYSHAIDVSFDDTGRVSRVTSTFDTDD